MHAILTLIALTIPAAHADPCATWGEITPESTSLVLGDSKEFFISGGDACGDVDACTWWLDENEGLGELSAESGSPVEWFSPETLEDCQQAVFRLYVECPAVDGGGSQIDDAEITLNCTGCPCTTRWLAGACTTSGNATTSKLALPLRSIPTGLLISAR